MTTEAGQRPVHLAKTASPLLVSKCGLTFSTSAMFRWTGGPDSVTCPACLTAMGKPAKAEATCGMGFAGDALCNRRPHGHGPHVYDVDGTEAAERMAAAEPRVISGLDAVAATAEPPVTQASPETRAMVQMLTAKWPVKPSPVEVGHAWRVGRKLGRTLYRDGECVGIVDTPELAEQIVTALGREATAEAPAQPEPAAPPPPARPSRVEVGLVKPTAVAVGQRWAYGSGPTEYAVTAGPDDEGEWATTWQCSDKSPLWLKPEDILCDEFLGLAAPVETPPAETALVCVDPRCGKPHPHAWDSPGCHGDTAERSALPAAPAPGVGEGLRELVFGEATKHATDKPGSVEIEWFTTPGHWMDYRPTEMSAEPWAWVRSRYRLKPEPLPAPAPKPGRVAELAAEYTKPVAARPHLIALCADVAHETLACVRRHLKSGRIKAWEAVDAAELEMLGAEPRK